MALSFTQQQTIYGDLSGNTSTANLSRQAYLANQEQKYLLQKYFSNEASFSITTVGSTNGTVTAAPALGAVSATLSSAWTYPTQVTSVTFSDGEQRPTTFTLNSTAITWSNALVGSQLSTTAVIAAGATTATLSTAWPYTGGAFLSQFSDGEQKTVTYTQNSTAISWAGGLNGAVQAYVNVSVCTTAIGIGGLQTYNLPPDYSKLETGTLTIGSLKWTPTEVLTRQQWDQLNVFPYYADIPNNIFIWQNQFNIWPIPSTTGNIITFNYKRRIPDLSIADYTTPGTVSVSNGSTVVTGSGTSWTVTTNGVSESRWIQFAPTATSSTSGDNLWYQIYKVNSATSLTLVAPYQGTTITSTPAGSYTVGQMPLLMEDFHDMLVWKPLIFYYTTIVNEPEKAKMFEALYTEKLEQLAEYAGSKTLNVNLSPHRLGQNPNLYPQSIGL